MCGICTSNYICILIKNVLSEWIMTINDINCRLYFLHLMSGYRLVYQLNIFIFVLYMQDDIF